MRFFLGTQRKAKRVLPIGHEPAGFYRVFIQRLLKRIQVDPLADIRRNRQRLEFQAFQRLQCAVETGILDNHPIPGFSHCLQTEIQRFKRASGNDDLFR